MEPKFVENSVAFAETAAPECCAICGKKLNMRTAVLVNYDNAYDRWLPPEGTAEHGEWGFQLLGPDCVRKLGVPASWIDRAVD